MKNTLRLLGTLALAAVSASIVHAQAFGAGEGYATLTFLGTTGPAGLAQTGYAVYPIGPFAVGASYTSAYSAGGVAVYGGALVAYSFSSGYSGAAPYGHSLSGQILDEQFQLSNANAYGITVLVGAYTFGGGYGYQAAAGQFGIGEGYGEIDINGFLVQKTLDAAVADNFLGVGNYSISENFDPVAGGVYARTVFPAGSPYGVLAVGSDYQIYGIYLAAGQTDSLEVISGEASEAYAQNVAVAPGPAAAAPFVLGAVGAYRRRKKRA
jgi:hypothetical protein